MSADYLLARTGENLPLPVDWSDKLNGATITASSWSIGPSGPVLNGGAVSGEIATIYGAFGASDANKTFVFRNQITDSAGATRIREIVVRCTVGVSGQDSTPDAFSFTDVADADLATQYTSDSITVSGIETSVAISVSGGTYSINGGSFTSSAGTVIDGDTVRVRRMSSGSYSTPVSVTLTIGGVSDAFSIMTIPDPGEDYAPSFDFSDARNSMYIALLEDI